MPEPEIALRKSLREFDDNFLKKVVDRINIEKLQNHRLRHYNVYFEDGDIVIKEQMQFDPENKSDDLVKSEMEQMRAIVKRSIHWVLKNPPAQPTYL